jgi:hypothetical protein
MKPDREPISNAKKIMPSKRAKKSALIVELL